MYYLTVDLASKFSAGVLRDSTGKVHWQGDSHKDSPIVWVKRLGQVAALAKDEDKGIEVLVEDVPYGISSQAMVKPVLRLQGMLILELDDFSIYPYFINPATWQSDYPGVGRAPKGLSKADALKYRAGKAAEYARELGYEPPNLVAEWQTENPDLKPLKKYTNPLEKGMTDYVDAFLMNDWLQRNKEDFRTRSGVQIAYI